MIRRMMVADEEDREGVKDFVVFSALPLGLGVDISQCVPDCAICILTGQTAVNEVVKHVNDY